jgi:hypothetical protein
MDLDKLQQDDSFPDPHSKFSEEDGILSNAERHGAFINNEGFPWRENVYFSMFTSSN